MLSRTFRRFAPDVPQWQGNRSRASCVLPRLLAVALAALIALPLAEATQTVEAGKNQKFKTITKTISSDGQIDIPAAGTSGPANPYPTTIDVDAFEKFEKVKITDVNLTLKGLQHERTENIDVMLVHGNRRALVMADPGNGTDVSDLTITLATLDGTDPDGQWQLFIHDDAAFETGRLTGGWELAITAKAKIDKAKSEKDKSEKKDKKHSRKHKN
jgi:subtilisin-like proprotein convertase family protein